MPTRREFLKSSLLAGVYFATAGAPRKASASEGPTGLFHFPQGVASADPRPESVVLWTRVESVEPCSDPVDLTLQVSESPEFKSLTVEVPVTATELTDHTVRVIVDGLKPDTQYHYRFRASNDYSAPLGRTRTAPAFDADREVRLAFVSCQNYEQGYFGAWQRMVTEDQNAAPDKQLDFVVHLGDFIYEYILFHDATPDSTYPDGPLKRTDGARRELPGFPDGAVQPNGRPYARSVDDYRHLYKTYLSDPALIAARARWPFVCTWDDHEFTNNAWQSRSTYTREGAPAPRRKVAANQAWFEYVPAMLSDLQGPNDELEPSRDFVFVEVEDTTANPYYDDPNNRAAIHSLTIYRRLRFGRHVDLIMTDCRSFRSDHAIPEELAVKLGGRDTAMLPVDVVNLLDAGRTANGGNPSKTFTLRGREHENPRVDAPAGTVLGADQKAWFKHVLKESNATWKLWGNSIPLMPLRLDLYDIEPPLENSVLSADSWDGYPGERTELMTFVKSKGIANLVSLSGDHHMHFAGELYDNFDAESPVSVGIEFSVGAISSKPTFWSLYEQRFLPPAFKNMAFMEIDNGVDREIVELFNLTLLQGAKAAAAAANALDKEVGRTMRNTRQNPHLRYIDSGANGYGLLVVDGTKLAARMVATTRASVEPPDEGSEIRSEATFEIAAWPGGSSPALNRPSLTGRPPYPFS